MGIDTGLYDCYICGHGGWKHRELKEGMCPFCYERENEDYDEDDECE